MIDALGVPVGCPTHRTYQLSSQSSAPQVSRWRRSHRNNGVRQTGCSSCSTGRCALTSDEASLLRGVASLSLNAGGIATASLCSFRRFLQRNISKTNRVQYLWQVYCVLLDGRKTMPSGSCSKLYFVVYMSFVVNKLSLSLSLSNTLSNWTSPSG